MKNPALFFSSAIFIILAYSCENKSDTTVAEILPQFEVTDNKDTINYLDVNGLKQGYWILYEVGSSDLNLSISLSADTAKRLKHYSCPSGKCITESGYYKNDKKIGFWKRFNNDGSVKDSVNYTSEPRAL